jgi:hypothetical protein
VGEAVTIATESPAFSLAATAIGRPRSRDGTPPESRAFVPAAIPIGTDATAPRPWGTSVGAILRVAIQPVSSWLV